MSGQVVRTPHWMDIKMLNQEYLTVVEAGEAFIELNKTFQKNWFKYYEMFSVSIELNPEFMRIEKRAIAVSDHIEKFFKEGGYDA